MNGDFTISGASRYGLQSFLKRLSIHHSAKFALVGAIGILVQLGTLKALKTLGCPYLVASGVAVEAAVLHNFVWHQRFTWSDRGVSRLQETGVRLLRFQVSNGAISIIGTLLLMRWLAGRLGMNVMVANLLTIAACAVGNFLASDRWVFLSTVRGAAKGS